MKKFLGILILALMTLSYRVFADSGGHTDHTDHTPEGMWAIEDRFCTYFLPTDPFTENWSELKKIAGFSTNDRFVLGRDEMSLMIAIYPQGQIIKAQSYVTIRREMDGQISSQQARINPATQEIESTTIVSTSDVVKYIVDQNDKLIMFSSGFGDGGTCSPGQTLVTIFSRHVN